jgi:hypothetical protein
MGPGNVAYTTPDAAIEPKICDRNTRLARIQPIAPINAIPRVTAGLNKPPDTRKNTHALTAKLKPKPSAIYDNALALGTWEIPLSWPPEPDVDALATCVVAKAMKRNRKVPTNLKGLGVRNAVHKFNFFDLVLTLRS